MVTFSQLFTIFQFFSSIFVGEKHIIWRMWSLFVFIHWAAFVYLDFLLLNKYQRQLKSNRNHNKMSFRNFSELKMPNSSEDWNAGGMITIIWLNKSRRVHFRNMGYFNLMKFDKQKVFENDWNYYDPHHHHHCHPDDQMGQTDTP